MELPPDFLLPRPNEEVTATLHAVEEDVASLLKEKDHTARRGRAYVLIEQLQYLVELPERLPALIADGAVSDADSWIDDAELSQRGWVVSSARPFDAGATGLFVEFLGRFSSLLGEPPGADVSWGFPGTLVAMYRLVHATATTTSRHLSDSSVVPRLAAWAGLQPSTTDGALIFCDPRGFVRSGGAVRGSLLLGATDRDRAVATADELSAALRIRLVVATCERVVDNH